MITHIRRFNELGIEKFRNLLHEVRVGEADGVPDSLVTDGYSCEIINAEIIIERKKFDTKQEIIEYIFSVLSKMQNRNMLYDVGMWTWLAAFFFDSIWKPSSTKKNNGVGEDARYVLNAEEWNKYYRHLLASPTRLYKELGSLSKIYLVGRPDINGELLENLASRQEVATCRAVIEAAEILYWDKEKNSIKRGVRGKGKGTVRRLAGATILQFQMTYDLNSMSGKELIQLLPNEYEGWINY
jgi:hypothetical protein